ncbi:hypothetical protein C1I98_26410 [Spongiactinospora gelatinilytica]|uniref:Uncharacterized protein n=1 Tax=Spongiactinospora gelatinilytica TaxID=2666298 RepID=A0A2W2HCK2_9ACTN|nr:permease prefix domain 1-containing protein [Spongiactinospora gelatinilytica]PZG36794.1 hypothetical protein C1I98_26410 [Spongiactinospora gelatinilytica]
MTSAPSGSLTDRYIQAVLTGLPARQRPEIERELRASIADAVEDRAGSGEPAADAEAAVLTGLGDPARLAAGYADGPRHLIGPALYSGYTRLLTALLVTAVPAVAVAVAGARAVQGATLSGVLGEALGAALTTGVHIALWTTVLFAVIERAAAPGRGARRERPWTPAALPDPPSRRLRYGELTSVTVATVLLCALILLSPMLTTERTPGGDPIGPLSPWLWETGVVYVFVALVVADLGYAFAKYHARWSVPLAVAGTVADVAPPVTLIWLVANGKALNPAFVQAAGWSPDVPRWVGIGLVVISVITVLNAVVGGIARARNR